MPITQTQHKKEIRKMKIKPARIARDTHHQTPSSFLRINRFWEGQEGLEAMVMSGIAYGFGCKIATRFFYASLLKPRRNKRRAVVLISPNFFSAVFKNVFSVVATSSKSEPGGAGAASIAGGGPGVNM